ncbi:MAG: sulfate transporter CysZ [Gammaproteobacteria bacterium]|nr:sulfate transporter CysZ [Gammaproteobacteria bacterium]
MSNPIKGAWYLLTGLKLIFKPGIRGYVAIPLSINIVLFAALIWFGAQQFGVFLDWLTPELPQWLQWLTWILWFVFAIGGLLILFFTFSLLANLVSAPFNGLLAEAVETYLTGQKPQGSNKNFIMTIAPAITNELKKMAYFILWAIPFLVLFFIPGVNLAAPVLWFIFSAWMLALEYADFPMGNHDIMFAQQRQRVSQKRFLNLGFGSAVSVATMTPFLNFLVMPAAVAGATALWVDQLKSLPNQKI